ncbi:MAG TPA: diacylglycerol kinase family protein [Bacteroidia bacterium]|jgi:diacylglycerol kinase (ATP)|nr:diacylglycerol kinase family protein [Bacteroidia bacterium]
MSHRKVFFVVNPGAGKKRNIDLKKFIETNFSLPEFKVAVSSSLEYFGEIKKEIIAGNYTDVVACGGDGTVNKLAAFACSNNIRLGILPLGSGNGLARSVGVSMNLHKALKQIENGRSKGIDVGVLNNKLFFCAAGMGFDSHVAALFEKTTSRGLWGYIKLIWKEFFSYKSQVYTLRINGQEINKKAFIVACCNTGQYGNDFYIAPTANMVDGKITVSLIKPFHWIVTPYVLLKVTLKKVHTLTIVETFHAEEIKIIRTRDGSVHIDGEPLEEGTEINIRVKPLALEIICA